MAYNTRKATKTTIRYRNNQGYQNHRQYFDDLKNFQTYRELNNDLNPNLVQPPPQYNLVFKDEFTGGQLDRNEWGTGVRWGTFHKEPSNHGFYFPIDGIGPNSTSISVAQDNLVLDCIYDPKTYYMGALTGRDAYRYNSLVNNCDEGIEGYYQKITEFTIDYNGGSVFSKRKWKKGWFEVIAKCPLNQYMWTGIWLQGVEFWPPEIDLVEHDSKSDETQVDPKPNIHIGSEGTNENHPDYGIKHRGWLIPHDEYGFIDPTTPMTLFKPYDRFVQYVCHWTDDFVKIFTDGVLYREYSTDKLFSLYRDADISMELILNNGVSNEYDHDSTFGIDHPFANAPMYIESVRVYQAP
ncbi:MAG: glycosyl hydrolase family protein [Flavobacteriia bacterium]|jgi:hypothetical protein|nr:glycosyl hydrolase family protein [Flavobacteriia bacterium]NDD80876.1 glycosyl hydrolase family protein [Flavobacteriia bacterium]